MGNRWLVRIMGGVSSLTLSAVMLITLMQSGLLNGTSVKAAGVAWTGNCNCTSKQTCCERRYSDGTCHQFCATACPAD